MIGTNWNLVEQTEKGEREREGLTLTMLWMVWILMQPVTLCMVKVAEVI